MQNKNKMIGCFICVWIFVISSVSSYSHDDYNIGGTTANGWEFVRDLFKENFVEE